MNDAAKTLRLYRSDHRIRVRLAADMYERCETDGIRVWPMKNGRYRHDPSDIVKLMEQEYVGAPWDEAERMDRAAVEVARDMIREDFSPRDELAERGTAFFEWGRHVVEVEVVD